MAHYYAVLWQCRGSGRNPGPFYLKTRRYRIRWRGGRARTYWRDLMILHPCPRCGALIPVGVSYCTVCKPEAEAQAAEAIERRQAYKQAKYNKDYNKRRDPKYLVFYRSKEWRAISRAKLQACGYRCELHMDGCTGLATEVDHIEAIQTEAGWDRRYDWDNLMGVCTHCHNLKHMRFKKTKDPGVIDLRAIDR